jgi:hypothetical protein
MMTEVTPSVGDRIIYSRSVPRQIPELLQSIFTAEIVAPSPCLWLVSPWVSNVPILDNSANAFRHIEPNWPQGAVRLIDVLVRLLEDGTSIHLAIRPRESDAFLDTLNRAARNRSRLHIHRQREERLHEKGLLSAAYYLHGSMNFTHNGVTVNEEQVTLVTDPEKIAAAHIEFKNRWGGAET